MWDGRHSTARTGDSRRSRQTGGRRRHRSRAGRASLAPRRCARLSISSSGCSRRRSSIRSAGQPRRRRRRSGPGTLAREQFCIGINDPLEMLPSMPGACAGRSDGLDPFVFTLFRGWTDLRIAASPGDRARRGDFQHTPVRHRQRPGPQRPSRGSGAAADPDRHVHRLPRHAERRQPLGPHGAQHRHRRCDRGARPTCRSIRCDAVRRARPSRRPIQDARW